MSAYFTSLVCISLVISCATALSYKDGGAERFAYSVILLFASLTPLVGAIGKMDVGKIFSEPPAPVVLESRAEVTTEEAFVKGIRAFVADEFDVDMHDVIVETVGFDISEMRAELIRIRLFGEARGADYRAIRERIEKNGFGRCEVKIEI